MKRFRLCLFDYNGTLQDDLHYIYECGPRRIFEKFGLPCPGIDEYRNQVSADFMKTFYWPHGIPPQVTAEDLNAIMKQAMKERGEPARLFPDALDAVRAVSSAGCRCALVSAYDSAKLNEALARHGLTPFFERIVGDARDKAADFRRLMDVFGAGPEETAAVGDMVEDAEASGRAGVTPFICPRGFHTRERIEAVRSAQPAVIIIDTLADLAAYFTG